MLAQTREAMKSVVKRVDYGGDIDQIPKIEGGKTQPNQIVKQLADKVSVENGRRRSDVEKNESI